MHKLMHTGLVANVFDNDLDREWGPEDFVPNEDIEDDE